MDAGQIALVVLVIGIIVLWFWLFVKLTRFMFGRIRRLAAARGRTVQEDHDDLIDYHGDRDD